MSDYSYGDMLRMQNEARQRVLEMQKRSKNAAEQFTEKSHKNKMGADGAVSPPDVARAISYPVEFAPMPRAERKNASIGRGGFDFPSVLHSVFGNISEDDAEKMLVLALCLLLSSERTDDSLILALMYLLT